MVYVEETLALHLYEALTDQFRPYPEVGVAVKGRGGHWQCIVRTSQRSCLIDCASHQVPRYHVAFNEDDHQQAGGWTTALPDVHGAVQAWIGCNDRADLYAQYTFIDRPNRALATLEATLIESCSALAPLIRHRTRGYNDTYDLILQGPSRGCDIVFMGYEGPPEARFSWDGCRLFTIPITHATDVARLLQRWLLEHAMPHALEQEFPWLTTGQLARYYEEGRGIEGEFLVSWDAIERYYAAIHRPISPIALTFIATLRHAGFDHTLRAGQSMWTFIVSRARHHGMGQWPWISFDFSPDITMDVTIAIGPHRVLKGVPVQLSAEITAFLTELSHQEIS
jgi:hypothetical protein